MSNGNISKVPGWAQGIAAIVSTAALVGTIVYNVAAQSFKDQLEIRIAQHVLQEKEVDARFKEDLREMVLRETSLVRGDIDLINAQLTKLEQQVLILEQKQLIDDEINKLVKDVSNTLNELKGDVRVLREKSTDMDNISRKIDSLSNQVAVINEKVRNQQAK